MGLHPNVRISVTGGGSGTGIAAMINGTVDLANASRGMKEEEFAAAQANGIDRSSMSSRKTPSPWWSPLKIPCTADPAADLRHLYRQDHELEEVGGEDRPIVLLSRESNSGTYVYFLENVIRWGRTATCCSRPTPC
jgi:phosphate transport system substrate-binding protein